MCHTAMYKTFSFWKFSLNQSVHLLMLMVFSTSCHSFAKPKVEGEALIELLKALNDSNGKVIDWNNDFVSPCFSWSHVTCKNGNVISLSLSANGFSGTLSPSITKLKFLVSLDLHDNNLSGVLPDYLGGMLNLQNLNLANNKFSGSIPQAWDSLSSLKNLDLSSNDLVGGVPLKLFSVPIYNFSNTQLRCGNGSHQPCASSSSVPAVTPGKSKLAIVIIGASCCAFILLLLGAIFICRYNLFCRAERDIFVDVQGEDERKFSYGQIRRFSWREIQIATEDFKEGNIIGKGGFGKVYKGLLSDKTKVAVKRLENYNSPGGEAAFLREIQLISVAVHRNLLRLIGFCTTPSERVLVYPFMQNLSVAYRLREVRPGEEGLEWPARKHIAFGAARGLEYLHKHCNPKIIHRDLKAANILLDDNFEPVLGDFGLAKLVDTKLTHVTTQVRGTMGHIAPEYLTTGKSSEKTDVFGYGITLLELVTGKRAIDFSRLEDEEDVLLLDHVKNLLREKRLNDIMDPNLKNYDVKEVEIILQVALLCTQTSPEDRPRMTEVISMLQGVGLTARWAEWEQLDEVRNHEFTNVGHKFLWGEDSTYDQEAVQLSEPR
ncbi:unnamed protein product [Cuscuta europaea]|uniref:non-specific serine/threonine protein kinase n=2 Tax=Cuscuta europaea TaxID=41803 RepID=A0A9P0ZSL7_CUSEU|nr:unnamed protein product [Cuscuta europaea]